MRTSTTHNLTNDIVQECHAQFDKLPKHGKPTKRSNGQAEWTILAGIVMATPAEVMLADQQSTTDTPYTKQLDAIWEIECISLAWCLQEMRTSIESPDRLRNKFKYIGKGRPSSQEQGSPVFELVNPRSQFHLYVSQAPCGDATTASLAQIQSEESRSAFMTGQQTQPKATSQEVTSSDQDQNTTQAAGLKRGRESELQKEQLGDVGPPLSKHQKRNPTTIDSAVDDSSMKNHQPDSNHALGFRRGRIDYDSVGVLRTKPGRVDSQPTLSMSCSDKIARWNVLGLTSALVAPFLKKPIYLESIITTELFDADALERALFGRVQDCLRRRTDHTNGGSSSTDDYDASARTPEPFTSRRIRVCKSDIAFEFSKEAVSKQSELEGINIPPVATASTSEPAATEVLVNGCKAGASAKKQIQPKSRSRLCKVNMFETSIALWRSISPKPALVQFMTTDTSLPGEQGPTNISYHEWKRLDKGYTDAKQQLFAGVFKNWVKSDSLLEAFNIHGDTIVKEQ
ncbi:tRNA-specific adenosine deaminase 1 [Mortierella sp. AD031]|nr:tRNA-specific adenosine deaminase 1 [Mortierella sp. AD031]